MFLRKVLEIERDVTNTFGFAGPFEWKFLVHADFETSISARIGKATGRNPQEIAEKIGKIVEARGFDAKVQGIFVNCFLKEKDIIEWLQSYELPKIITERIVIDYSSPNIAKPFSVGHLRSTVIGDSLRRLFQAFGASVVGLNFVGDWGTQFGKLLLAYLLWGDRRPEDMDIRNMFNLYVRFHKEAEKDPGLEEKAKEVFKKLEEGDEELLRIWKIFKEKSMKEFEKLYRYLGILPLKYYGESLFKEKAIAIVETLIEKGIARVSEGAVIVEFEDLPPLVLRKSDGTTLYASRDIASALDRIKRFKADRSLYVVGKEQKLHFTQIFRVLKLLGVKIPLEYIPFGLITLPEGKMSTRKGRVVFLEDVIGEAETRVKRIAEGRGVVLNAEDTRKIVVAAIKFADLKNYRLKDVRFTWNILEFTGDTGPYLQYMGVRAKKVLEKYGSGKKPKNVKKSWEKLAKMLLFTQYFAWKALQDRRPDILANHLLGVAKEYSRVYEKLKFRENAALLWLNERFYQIFKEGLYLLGIEIPEKM